MNKICIIRRQAKSCTEDNCVQTPPNQEFATESYWEWEINFSRIISTLNHHTLGQASALWLNAYHKINIMLFSVLFFFFVCVLCILFSDCFGLVLVRFLSGISNMNLIGEEEKEGSRRCWRRKIIMFKYTSWNELIKKLFLNKLWYRSENFYVKDNWK